ncbi:Calponin-3 [Desmophyllum pertusum]|uniref:Calponin-3 n=1 Tax=Desmophyllum pertusum TaxID=174260 RepID=A0A9X0CLE6_9CNID|nr:Calponin-3 [Desmophyllum pertusum]
MNNTTKVSNAAMRANKEKENIEKFLNFCKAYGVKDTDCFSTPALYQKQNVMAAVITICQLGSTAQSKGFTGPTLGPKKADENKRDFTEEQVKAGREGHIGLQAGGGTEKLASQSGQNFGLGRQIAGTGSGDSQYK